MHIDARELENNTTIHGDICIVGAGAAGISIALDWIGTKFKVILLEGGGFEYDDKVQDLYKGKTTGQKYYPLKSTRLHYFGGTTAYWGGMCSPFDDLNFKKRDWVPHSGWPISKNDLEKYYKKACKTLKLSSCDFEYEYWNKILPNLKPFPFNKEVIWNKMWQYSLARFRTLYKKTIVDATNIHLYTYANAVDIKTEDNLSTVKNVVVKNSAGKTHIVKAKHFIMACGTIQNARMLLASNSQASNGLGNSHDLVGRYFQEHLEIGAGELWLAKPFPTDLYSWQYGESKASAELAITEEVQAREKILNGTLALKPLQNVKYKSSKMEVWQDEDPRKSRENNKRSRKIARAKAKPEKATLKNAFQLDIRIEQSPNPNSRVTISAERDALGVQRANLHWELTALEKYSTRKIYHLLANQAGISGIGRIRLKEFLWDENDDTFPQSVGGGWHHMGTARMADDPKKGVVDSNCRVHGISNLFIAGAACFPTSGAPNPTLSLTALSLRLSDHIKSIFY